MNGRRAVVGVLAPLALAMSALAVSPGVAFAAGAPHPKPHPPAVTAAQCTAAHGKIVPGVTKKKHLPTKHCQGGTLNGRKVKP
jgi:hypothetical protein